MDATPPCELHGEPSVPYRKTDKDTYDVVVLAADGLLGAGGGDLPADDGHRVALDANLADDVLDADAESTEQRKASGGVGLGVTLSVVCAEVREKNTHVLEVVAALDGSGVAVTDTTGEGEEREGEEGSDGGDASDHCECGR